MVGTFAFEVTENQPTELSEHKSSEYDQNWIESTYSSLSLATPTKESLSLFIESFKYFESFFVSQLIYF